MLKVLWRWFEKCCSTFTKLLVKWSSEMGLFRHLSDHVFGVSNFRNTKSMTVIFFSKYLKFIVDFKNAAKKWAKVFYFWDNCIWISIIKLFLLRRGYFSSAANVLTSSSKILHVNQRYIFQLNWLFSDQWIV